MLTTAVRGDEGWSPPPLPARSGRVRRRGLDSGGAASGQGQRRSGRDLAYCTDFSAGSLKKAALRGEGVV